MSNKVVSFFILAWVTACSRGDYAFDPPEPEPGYSNNPVYARPEFDIIGGTHISQGYGAYFSQTKDYAEILYLHPNSDRPIYRYSLVSRNLSLSDIDFYDLENLIGKGCLLYTVEKTTHSIPCDENMCVTTKLSEPAKFAGCQVGDIVVPDINKIKIHPSKIVLNSRNGNNSTLDLHLMVAGNLTWEPISKTNAPPALNRLKSHWINKQLLLWGVPEGHNKQGEVFSLDTANNQWDHLPITNQPTYDKIVDAVWQGETLFVISDRSTAFWSHGNASFQNLDVPSLNEFLKNSTDDVQTFSLGNTLAILTQQTKHDGISFRTGIFDPDNKTFEEYPLNNLTPILAVTRILADATGLYLIGQTHDNSIFQVYDWHTRRTNQVKMIRTQVSMGAWVENGLKFFWLDQLQAKRGQTFSQTEVFELRPGFSSPKIHSKALFGLTERTGLWTNEKWIIEWGQGGPNYPSQANLFNRKNGLSVYVPELALGPSTRKGALLEWNEENLIIWGGCAPADADTCEHHLNDGAMLRLKNISK